MAKQLTRRSFLRAASGVGIALPIMDFCGWGDSIVHAAPPGQIVPRLITFYFPNGCDPDFWNYNIACAPLAPIASKIALIQGLDNTVSKAFGRDSHEQGGATLFSGFPLAGDTKSNGASIDQIASRTLDAANPLNEPLVVGVWRGFAGGFYRSISWSRRSWRADGSPVEPLQNPVDIFNRIFGLNRSQGEVVEAQRRKSVLDHVVQEYRSQIGQRSGLSGKGKQLLQDHLDRIREIESSSVRFEADWIQTCRTSAGGVQNVPPIQGGLFSYDQFELAFNLQIQMVLLALRCGVVNTASLMHGCAGEEYTHPSIAGLPDHAASHYQNEGDRQVYLAYRHHYMRLILSILNGMNNIPESNGKTMLDNSIFLAGSEFGESRNHVISPQPHLYAGGLGKLQVGGTYNLPNHTPNDLYRTIMEHGLGISGPVGLPEHNRGMISQLMK